MTQFLKRVKLRAARQRAPQTIRTTIAVLGTGLESPYANHHFLAKN